MDISIFLKPLSIHYVTPFYRWLNDPVAIKYSLSLFQSLNTKEAIDKWFTSVVNDSKNYNRGIYLGNSNTLIGYAGICNISLSNKLGEYFIFIGDRNQWGKGAGSQVTKLIVDIGFKELNLNRIMLTVSEPNYAAVKAYTNTGFKLEGKMRQACYRDNKFHDKLIMSILREEWNN
ncbi:MULTISPECIES: GNAT family N-acetyltransferase [unclassified Sphingobacterium]|uniref:GNAT family N-acetyltransferase n=1 Tax=unclassified Sphingobacterium TaxID=2609468 RepID=UPI0025D893B7|nr:MULTISPECIES: GNAT family protein [unclassified Sphingobacterium]